MTNWMNHSCKFTSQADIPVACLDKDNHIMNFVGLQKEVLAVELFGLRF